MTGINIAERSGTTPTGVRYSKRMSGNLTDLFCIIGMPARHSLSPAMHNAAFRKLGMDAVFLAFDVPPESLKPMIDMMRGTGMKGMTLTSPHKIEVMNYIDRIDPKAKAIGAVNTVINRNGVLTGYNTDAPGFIKAIKKVTVTKGKKFVVLGAGGAARAFVFEILESVSNPSITILNRHLSKALEVKKDAEELGYSGIRALKLDDTNLELALGSADIVANATNITLENASATPVPKRLLKKGMVVFDANYVPLENRLVRDARASGCKVVTGKDLLLYQGVVAFKLFTGVEAPEREMLGAIDSALRLRNSKKEKRANKK
ncbi:MAG: shikimate dehydrogenase [Candidatus Marsarchaeota archaeon]|nr:shikimate dehydrogenase [Candidatus Marsarchaeota archaeon]